MTLRTVLTATVATSIFLVAGCNKQQHSVPTRDGTAGNVIARDITPSALPDGGFKAQITVVNPPAKLRAGQKESIPVRVKNVSHVMWYARGAEVNANPGNKFYLAVGNRWLRAEGEQLVTNMDGRYGLPKNLKPGEEVEVSLQITAPKDAGEYILEVDLVQEQVAWFSDKGSPTAKVKVAVVQ